MEKIALIGAGVMGLTVSRRIIEAGYELTVCDRIPAAMEKAKGLGADLAQTPAESARLSDIILLLLPGPREVEGCVAAPDGILAGARPGAVIVDMSTVDPGTTQRMAALAEPKKVGYLDAPVLGRPATVGQWALPVGGKEADLARCRPLLETFAKHVLYIGRSGSGHKIKLLNQMMFGAINAMTAEMMAVASKMGISPGVLYHTITASQAGTVSNLFKELGRRVSENDYSDPTFTVDLLVKDVKLGIKMAGEHGAPPVMGKTIDWINEVAQAQGDGTADTAMMWKNILKLWEKRSNN